MHLNVYMVCSIQFMVWYLCREQVNLANSHQIIRWVLLSLDMFILHAWGHQNCYLGLTRPPACTCYRILAPPASLCTHTGPGRGDGCLRHTDVLFWYLASVQKLNGHDLTSTYFYSTNKWSNTCPSISFQRTCGRRSTTTTSIVTKAKSLMRTIFWVNSTTRSKR